MFAHLAHFSGHLKHHLKELSKEYSHILKKIIPWTNYRSMYNWILNSRIKLFWILNKLKKGSPILIKTESV